MVTNLIYESNDRGEESSGIVGLCYCPVIFRYIGKGGVSIVNNAVVAAYRIDLREDGPRHLRKAFFDINMTASRSEIADTMRRAEGRNKRQV